MKIPTKIISILKTLGIGITILVILFGIQIYFYNHILKPEIESKINKETLKQIFKYRQKQEFRRHKLFNQNKNRKIKC